MGGSHFILFVGSKIHSFGVNDGKPKENQPIYFFPLLLFLDSESFVTSSDEIGERKKMSKTICDGKEKKKKKLASPILYFPGTVTGFDRTQFTQFKSRLY